MSSRPVPSLRSSYASSAVVAVYRQNEVNHCPGCGHTHWFIGRMSAECARCATALPLATSVQDVYDGRITRGHQPRHRFHQDVPAPTPDLRAANF